MEFERRKKVRAALISVFSNIALVIMKMVVGLAIGSVSIMSEAIHSASDLVAALIALFSVRTSSKPADLKHPFGHGKIENISGALEALLIFLAAAWIILEAFKKLAHPEPIRALEWGVAVMMLSAIVNYFVSDLLFKVGGETDSIALKADAWHLRTDVYTSGGVMISLGIIWVGGAVSPGLYLVWLDPVIAILVALFIVKAAYSLTVQSVRDLIDVRLPDEEEAWITETIKNHGSDVHGIHDLRTRKAGHQRFIEFHMKVHPKMSVDASHRITEDITSKIRKRFPSSSVTIHIEPCDGRCEMKCLEGCLLPVKGDITSKVG
jgi:cation diffusion facilitator family transporter